MVFREDRRLFSGQFLLFMQKAYARPERNGFVKCILFCLLIMGGSHKKKIGCINFLSIL